MGLGSEAVAFGASFCAKIEIICSIGVIPQIGSLENGKLYEIAPSSLPLTYTGDPDIPAKTDVRSAPPPLILPTMRSCRGPIPPGTTPSISTLNSSASLPRKTVRATPRIPSRTSETDMKALGPPPLRCAMLTGSVCADKVEENTAINAIRTRIRWFGIWKNLFLEAGGYGNISGGFPEAFL